MGSASSKCDYCERGNCNHCDSPATCTCKCNVGGGHDKAQKAAAIAGGVLAVAGGVALTIVTGGLAGVVIGGVVVGAGASSSVNGITKAVKKEKMSASDYFTDVGIGAATGIVTGGIGGAGEAVAATVTKNMVREGLKVGATKLGVRMAAGAVSGIASKVTSEGIGCAVDDRKFGEGTTAGDWLGSALLGGIGGSFSHATNNVANKAASAAVESFGAQDGLVGAVKFGVRVAGGATEGVTTSTIDASIQAASGKEINLTGLGISTALSATQAAVSHGGRQAGHAINISTTGYSHNKTYKHSRKTIKKMKDGAKKQGALHDRDDAAKVAKNLKHLDRCSTVEEVGNVLTKAYTDETFLYRDMNAMHRSGDINGHNLEPLSKAFNESLILQGGKKTQRTHRGVNISNNNPNRQTVDLQRGEDISFPGFTSTSENPSTARRFARGTGTSVIMEIEGRSGVDISKISAFATESEFLYPAGTTFNCTERRVNENTINLTLVQTAAPKPQMAHELISPYLPPQHWRESGTIAGNVKKRPQI